MIDTRLKAHQFKKTDVDSEKRLPADKKLMQVALKLVPARKKLQLVNN